MKKDIYILFYPTDPFALFPNAYSSKEKALDYAHEGSRLIRVQIDIPIAEEDAEGAEEIKL